MNILLFLTILLGIGSDEPATRPRREFRYRAADLGRATYSHDGRLVLVTTNKQRVGIFHGRTALLVDEFKGHKQPVVELASWPDRDTVVSGGAEGELLFWTTRKVQLLGRAQVAGRVQAIAPQPGSATVAVLANNVAWLIDVPTGRKMPLANWAPGRTPSAIAFNAAGTHLAIGYTDGSLLINNLIIKQSVAATPFQTPVRAIAFRRDSLLAVAGTSAVFLSRASSPGSGKVVELSKPVWSVAQPARTGLAVLGTQGGEVLGFDLKTQTEKTLGVAATTVRGLVANPRESVVLANYQQAAPKSWLLREE
jgi:WD40 repeat protein